MARTVEEIDAEIERLQEERDALTSGKWLEKWRTHFPSDLRERLFDAAEQAAGACHGHYATGEAEAIEIAPGLSFLLTFDTNLPELAYGEKDEEAA